MAQNVSAGVYTKIIDLSDYVQSVPSTIGFIPFISEQGEDNVLRFTGRKDFFIDYGEPNINYATKLFGQGHMVATSFLTESDSLYALRCLPTDATYSNLILSYDSSANITAGTRNSLNTLNEIETHITEGTGCVVFRGVGRGEFYNNFKVKISKHANPQLSDPVASGTNDIVYVLDVYKRQDENDENGSPQFEIISSFEVSFNPTRLDLSGESMFVEDVVNRYSRYIKCIADKDRCLDAVTDGADFSAAFSNSALMLDNGSSGSLFDASGRIDVSVAKQILTKAYSGDLAKPFLGPNGETLKVSEVVDTDNYYFTIVMDGGYPTDVKINGIFTLISARKDCIALVDNGDNINNAAALSSRQNNHNFNTKYIAMYEPYSKIYDQYTGRDVWVTPVYHMAKIVPYTDNVAEIWSAAAGFNRATVSNIKELRFSPGQGERDELYLNQINPIVKFHVGNVVFSQLTTQRKPTALQDLSVVRLLLYIKRTLEQYCKYYIFEQNDQFTWSTIQNEITNFLKTIQNKRGLYNFSVAVGATEYEMKAKQIHVDVSLEPIKAVEQIYLNFYIK